MPTFRLERRMAQPGVAALRGNLLQRVAPVARQVESTGSVAKIGSCALRSILLRTPAFARRRAAKNEDWKTPRSVGS